MYRQDFIKRQIELFAEAIARLTGLHGKGRHEEALAEARNAFRALGVDRALLELDALTLVRMLRDRTKLEALCQLLEAEAAVHESRGADRDAAWLRQRATAIRAELTGGAL